jgi:transcriptional regulator with PAS, ATPase and Fis domain
MSSTLENIKFRFGIVGHAPKLNTAIEIAVQVAPTEVTVLVVGENGTGKDVFSRIIHQFSRRKHQPFIAINCGAIPEGTMDSELFGHEKGSFTSAYEQRKGYFEEVDTGTIFLDEIAEMPLATQARLLRVLENGEYLRVGSSKVRKTDVRVIAATNKNLIDLIRRGKFREDLYFRLNTVTINVPALRDRGSDLEMLFHHFAEEFAARYRRAQLILSQGASDMMHQYRWPGNVRELRNFSEKVSVLVPGAELLESDVEANLDIRETYLPVLADRAQGESGGGPGTYREIELLYKLFFDLREEVGEMKKMLYLGIQPQPSGNRESPHIVIPGHGDEEPGSGDYRVELRQSGKEPYREFHHGDQVKQVPLLEESLSLESKENEMISRALRKHGSNRKKAAQELGISERTLYRKIKQFGLE